MAAAHEGISLECLLGCQYHWLAWATIHFPWLPQHSFVPPLDFSIIDFIIQHRWNICHALAHCHWVTKSWTAFVTPRTTSRQTSLSFTIAQSWRLNCTLGFCRGITNGHRTQNIHIHTYIYIYTHTERERDRDWDWLILKSWLRGSWSLRSPNIHSQQSGDLGELIVQFQSKNCRAWDPKRACFSLSLKTERLKSPAQGSLARGPSSSGGSVPLVPFRSLLGWGPPTWGRAIYWTQATHSNILIQKHPHIHWEYLTKYLGSLLSANITLRTGLGMVHSLVIISGLREASAPSSTSCYSHLCSQACPFLLLRPTPPSDLSHTFSLPLLFLYLKTCSGFSFTLK